MQGDRNALLRKLIRIEALVQGATTEGERTAANRAKDRLVERLGGDVPSGRIEAPTMDFDPLAPPPGAHLDTKVRMPTHTTLVKKLKAWEAGELGGRALEKWARRYVDRMLLPDLPPDHQDSLRVEAILQLSSLTRQPFLVEDVPAMVAFLQTPKGQATDGWRQWFAYLESIDWLARRRT